MSNGKVNPVVPSLQDFRLIHTYVEKVRSEQNLQTGSLGFYFFVLDLILSLQPDEIEDSITDNFFLRTRSQDSGHDRGIDAIYVDSSQSPHVVHIFNMKYTEAFENTRGFFPGGEIDKISGFISALMQQDEELCKHVNPMLASKIQEIWTIFQSQNPRFVMHICANYYQPFEKNERQRFERELEKYSFFSIQYHLMGELVEKLTHKGRQSINGKIKAIDRNLFEKSGGDVRALIVEVEARDLIRIVLDDEETRAAVNLTDYTTLRQFSLLESAFEDNVRIYLKQRSKINQNIKSTALGEENHRFFYYNNGITLTCSRFEYPKGQRGPIIELENIQIVNGGQTIHALYEAFRENPEKFEDIEVLCRIYQTGNQQLSTSIAEFTNSQNPVQSRDIRSNDFTQKKLEKELLAKGWFYERKKNQHHEKLRLRRIDAEKAGQVVMAFFGEMPAEAKAHKRLIFAEKYDEVFSDNLSADGLLLCLLLFAEIEQKKSEVRAGIAEDGVWLEVDSFILHASYYILFLLKRLAVLHKIPLELNNKDEIFALYPDAMALIRKSVELEMSYLQGPEKYNHRVFFVGNRPKKHLESLLTKWPTWQENQ
jgi:hypothetical protein